MIRPTKHSKPQRFRQVWGVTTTADQQCHARISKIKILGMFRHLIITAMYAFAKKMARGCGACSHLFGRHTLVCGVLYSSFRRLLNSRELRQATCASAAPPASQPSHETTRSKHRSDPPTRGGWASSDATQRKCTRLGGCADHTSRHGGHTESTPMAGRH